MAQRYTTEVFSRMLSPTNSCPQIVGDCAISPPVAVPPVPAQ
jgi:hypothetical protein